MLTIVAYAKINLGLEVLGRRDDVYHDVVTILQEIGLGDRVSLERSRHVTFESDDLSIAPDQNLILRAAHLLQAAVSTNQGAVIRLAKSIPVAGGLGGGSADAAATLRGLNRLWNLNLGDASLCSIARSLGSDVPFFVRGGTQLARGRGDELSRLPTPPAWVVVVGVDESIPQKTRRLYESLRPDDFSDGSRVQAIVSSLQDHGPLLSAQLVNTFERPALELFPGVRRAYEAVRAAGAHPLLAGAGPTVVSIHQDELGARIVASELTKEGLSVIVAPTVPSARTDLPAQTDCRMGRGTGYAEGS